MKKEHRSGRAGRALTVLLVLLFVVVVNLFASKLVETYDWKLDMTASGLYSVSDETKELMKTLTQDVDIYCVCTSRDAILEFSEMLDRYAACSDYIHVTYVDPSTDLALIDAYEQQGVSVKLNTLIVESGSSRRVFNMQDMYKFSTDGSLVSFNGEAQITSAIMNVTAERTQKAVFLMGHGEDVPAELESLIVSYGYDLSGFVLNRAVPEEVGAIWILAPQTDLSDTELAYLEQYLAFGGSVLYFKDPQVNDLENLDAFLSEWGIRFEENVVMDANYNIDTNPMYVVANYVQNEINSYFETHNYYVVLPAGNAISQDFSNAANAEVSVVLASSDHAYGRSLDAEEKTLGKQAADEAGPFVLAVSAVRSFAQADGTSRDGRIFACGSRRFYSDDLLTLSSVGNSIYCAELLNWATGSQNASYPIAGKSVGSQSISVTSGQITMLGILLVAVIPLTILAYGAVVVVKRRYL